MKNFILFFFVILIAGCALLNPPTTYEKALAEATAQRWSGGAQGSGRGVIFTVKFYALPEAITADTLVVNNIPIEAAVSKAGDTTYITSTFMAENGEARTLANDPSYSGRVVLWKEGKKHTIWIREFSFLPRLIYP